MKNVTSKTRAGWNGKIIFCPVCDDMTVIYHFAWSALYCSTCNSDVKKTDWFVRS